jgi:hypothetical protein
VKLLDGSGVSLVGGKFRDENNSSFHIELPGEKTTPPCVQSPESVQNYDDY